ncbi:MAG: translocation/assembly module TamB domain-containing protein [Gemmatimonadota bacterium]|nr:translocation/assembly module TamB domain-containing protein [Gemmatimonadota bacterium]
MSRRRIVLYVSLGLVLALVTAVGTGVLVLTRSGWGQDQVRRLVQRQLASAVHGHVYVGRITGSYLGSVTLDSLEIRDAEDSLFVASGRVSVEYDPRDIMDKRLLFTHVDVRHPTVYLRQHENWDWNFNQIFRHGRVGPKATGPQYGDYVVLDSVRLHDATFLVTQPWHPDDSLHGAKRDSAIAAALASRTVEIRRRREGFARTRRWTHIDAELAHARLNDPDSAGRFIVVDNLKADEQDPPFQFHDVAGTVRILGDSVWLRLSRFALPGSFGSGSGKVVWGSDLPVRYDLHIVGDSVSMADVDWIYPTLPTTGGGSVVVDIKNERDLNVVDYRLTKMDVQAARSRLRGAMTFGVGGPVLQVKDVSLQADPVDFDLLRTLNGKAFPVDWQGRVFGTVAARGGPLTHFAVDTANLTFHDAHVPGAVSTLGGHGELDILRPAFTAFHRFNVSATKLDLRTVEFLYPNFPRLAGWMSGSATLDSSWLDVRFQNADVQYHDGDAPMSRLLGSGRVTYGDPYMTYDASLYADSLSLTALRRSYPGLPLVGTYSGTIQAQGTVPDLLLDASLRGPDGAMSFSGHVDVDPPMYGAVGSGRVVGLDPSTAVAMNGGLPAGSITGNYDVNVRFDSLGHIDGAASASLERSEFDRVHVFASRAYARFADGRVYVDTLRLETSAATLSAQPGALGLHTGVVDSLKYTVNVDSLGGLRPFLATRNAVQTGVPDSLAGAFVLTGALTGNLDSLNARGDLTGSSIYMNKDRGASARGNFAFDDVLRAPHGVASFELDTLVLAGVRVDTIGFEARLAQMKAGGAEGFQFAGTFGVGALSDNGPTFAVDGTISHAQGRTELGVQQGSAHVGGDVWRLAGPGAVRLDSALTTIDTLRMTNGRGGVLSLAGRVPAGDSVHLRFRADSIPVRDVATLLQVADTMSGFGSLHADVSGTRAAPVVTADAVAGDLRYGTMQLQQVRARATYARKRTDAALEVYRDNAVTLQASASLPMVLELYNARLLDDSLRGTIRADSTDFAIIEAFVPNVSNAKGRLLVALDVGGTWHHPTLNGTVQMHDAQIGLNDLGITLRGLTADLAVSAVNDSLAVRRLSAWSGPSASDRVLIGGFVDFANRNDPSFRLWLNAHQFRAVDKRTLARLDISTGPTGRDTIWLRGRKLASTLSGPVNIVRGTIYIPERSASKKQMIQLSYQDLQGIDTTDLATRIHLPTPPSAVGHNMAITGMQVTLGDEVWLRSQEANIKLVGSLNVRRTRQITAKSAAGFQRPNAATEDTVVLLALDGTLTAERGTYTLAFGPLQREFQVESGTITYYGDPELNPKINVSAVYTVRQSNRPDVSVRATLSGYLYPGPSLDLTSGTGDNIPQSDLVSYLCCGVPSFELGANQSYLQTAAQVLLPTASSVLAHTLRGQLGSTFDILQFQPGATDETSTKGVTTTSAARQFFSGARLGGEKQITNNLFFSISTGLCQFTQSQTGGGTGAGASAFVEQLESKLQYRFSSTLSADVGLEPPSSALLCGRTQRGLVPTPQQWGLSLSKTWRW